MYKWHFFGCILRYSFIYSNLLWDVQCANLQLKLHIQKNGTFIQSTIHTFLKINTHTLINHQSELIDMHSCQWRTSYWMVQQTQVLHPCYWSSICVSEHVRILPEALAAAAAVRPSPVPCLFLQCSLPLAGNLFWSRPSAGETYAVGQSCQTGRYSTDPNPEKRRQILETKNVKGNFSIILHIKVRLLSLWRDTVFCGPVQLQENLSGPNF